MSENLYFDKSDRDLLDIVNSTTEQKTDVNLEQKRHPYTRTESSVWRRRTKAAWLTPLSTY